VPTAFRDCPNGTVVSTLDMPRTSLDGSRVLVVGGGQGAARPRPPRRARARASSS
jgi:lysine/ornithine N-monooxygenase